MGLDRSRRKHCFRYLLITSLRRAVLPLLRHRYSAEVKVVCNGRDVTDAPPPSEPFPNPHQELFTCL